MRAETCRQSTGSRHSAQHNTEGTAANRSLAQTPCAAIPWKWWRRYLRLCVRSPFQCIFTTLTGLLPWNVTQESLLRYCILRAQTLVSMTTSRCPFGVGRQLVDTAHKPFAITLYSYTFYYYYCFQWLIEWKLVSSILR